VRGGAAREAAGGRDEDHIRELIGRGETGEEIPRVWETEERKDYKGEKSIRMVISNKKNRPGRRKKSLPGVKWKVRKGHRGIGFVNS